MMDPKGKAKWDAWKGNEGEMRCTLGMGRNSRQRDKFMMEQALAWSDPEHLQTVLGGRGNLREQKTRGPRLRGVLDGTTWLDWVQLF